MKCIKIILLGGILFHNSYTRTAQSYSATDNQSYNPHYLETVFDKPSLFILLQPRFKKQLNIKKRSPVAKFLKGKKIEDKNITEGQILLFRMIFIELHGQHQGETLPYSVSPNQSNFSYDAAYFTLPKIVQTFLIKKNLICEETSSAQSQEQHLLQEQPPSYADVLRENSYAFTHRTIGAAALRTYQTPQARTESISRPILRHMRTTTSRPMRTTSNSQLNLTTFSQYELHRIR